MRAWRRLRAWRGRAGDRRARRWRARPRGSAVPATSGGSCRRRRPALEQFQRLEARRRRQHPDPDRLGRRSQPVQGGAVRLVRASMRSSAAPRGAASTCCPSSSARRPGRCLGPVPGTGGLKAPKTLPVAAAPQRARLDELPQRRRSLATGRGGSFWAENPACRSGRSAPGRSGTSRTSSTSSARPNPAEYGKLVKLSYAGDQRASTRARRSSSAACSPGPREATFKRKPPQAYFATDFLDQMYSRRRGSSRSSTASPCTPTPRSYQHLTPRHRRSPRDVLKSNHDAGKGLWITELGWSSEPPQRAGNSFAKGPRGQAKQLKGAFGAAPRATRRKWQSAAGLLVLGRRPARRLQLLRRLRPLRRTASCRSRPGTPTSSSPAADGPYPPLGRPGSVRSVGWPPIRKRVRDPTRWRRSAPRSGAGSRPPSRRRRRPRWAAGRRSPAAPTR